MSYGALTDEAAPEPEVLIAERGLGRDIERLETPVARKRCDTTTLSYPGFVQLAAIDLCLRRLVEPGRYGQISAEF